MQFLVEFDLIHFPFDSGVNPPCEDLSIKSYKLMKNQSYFCFRKIKALLNFKSQNKKEFSFILGI